MNEVLSRIRDVINAINVSDSAFAKRICVKQSSFSGLFQRDVIPRADILISITNEYGVDPTWLLTGQGTMFFDLAGNRPNQNGTSQKEDPGYKSDSATKWQNRNNALRGEVSGGNDGAASSITPDQISMVLEVMEMKGMLAEGSGGQAPCPVCHFVKRLSKERQDKVAGYAEALYREQEAEENAAENQNAG